MIMNGKLGWMSLTASRYLFACVDLRFYVCTFKICNVKKNSFLLYCTYSKSSRQWNQKISNDKD